MLLVSLLFIFYLNKFCYFHVIYIAIGANKSAMIIVLKHKQLA